MEEHTVGQLQLRWRQGRPRPQPGEHRAGGWKQELHCGQENALACQNKISEIQAALSTTVNLLASNTFAKKLVQTLRKGIPALEKHRKELQTCSTAAALDANLIKNNIKGAFKTCEEYIGHLKSANKFM